MLFRFGDTKSSESKDPDLAIEGAGGRGDSSGLGRKVGILSSLVCGWETCTRAREGVCSEAAAPGPTREAGQAVTPAPDSTPPNRKGSGLLYGPPPRRIDASAENVTFDTITIFTTCT